MPKIIIQRWGIGDAIMSMSAIRSLGDKILWPVMSDYVDGCNAAYPDITFIDWKLINIDFNRKDKYSIGGWEAIPLAWQDAPLSWAMKNKYLYFGLPWEKWKDNAYYTRDIKKEKELSQWLGIKEGESYNLINNKFGTNLNSNSVAAYSTYFPIPENGLKNIIMDIVSGYSLFDWSRIIESAENIFTVSTSLLFLIELLSLQAKEIHLYPRIPDEKDFRNVDYLFTKPYILHT